MGYETLEGWCTDPYAQHEARWLSDGKPTTSVRDDGATSYDEPSAGGIVRVPVLIEPNPDASDLLRADDGEGNSPPQDQSETFLRQMDAVASAGAPLRWIQEFKGPVDRSVS